MALDEADVELIQASWVPARKDSVGAGVLLFKGLFTKFPDYLRLFNQFADLDLERLHENKRLVKHAVKVIETVTFVVDSIGDLAKANELNEALVGLVRGHLKRRIGLTEFRNLGIVLIDFVCDLNNRRGHKRNSALLPPGRLIDPSGTSLASNNNNNPMLRNANSHSTSSSQDSETMTSTLDKIRASSSPSSSSEDESLLLARTGATLHDQDPRREHLEGSRRIARSGHCELSESQLDSGVHEDEEQCELEEELEPADEEKARLHRRAKIDASLLVAAWTKLYGIILELVKGEENQAGRT